MLLVASLVVLLSSIPSYSYSQSASPWLDVGLTPLLSSLAIMENAESESEVLGLGLSVIALNLGMYLGVPVIIVIGIKKSKN